MPSRGAQPVLIVNEHGELMWDRDVFAAALASMQALSGQLTAGMSVNTELPAAAALADATALPTTPIVGIVPMIYNGTNTNLQRGNQPVTLLASAARTALVTGSDQINYNHRGIMLFVNVTDVTATGIITITLQGKDPVSGTYYTILASAGLATTGLVVMQVIPSLAVVANLAASAMLPYTWRVNVGVFNAVAVTYSIGAVLLV